MYKEFSLINYVGGIATLPQCCDLTVIVDNNYRRISLKKNGVIHSHLNFEDIEEVSLHKKSIPNAGTASVQVIIAGVLISGIKFLFKAAPGVWKRDGSTICISYKRNGKIVDILLNAKRETANLHASISSALATNEPIDFDRSRANITQTPSHIKLSAAEGVLWVIFGIMIFILLRSCMSMR